MVQALQTKLETYAALGEAERGALRGLTGPARAYAGGEHLIEEGMRPDAVFVLTEGWACRYKVLPDGRRQIMAYLLPGDTCDVFNFVLGAMDHSIAALGPCKAVAVPQAELMAVVAEHPGIARALYWTTLVDAATSREWLLNIGQRDGFGRAAHLFSELLLRAGLVGLAPQDAFALPLTQADLADTMGLSPVYVNRMLQRMRGDGLITLERRRLTIHLPERLAELGAFNALYLHQGRTPDWDRSHLDIV